MACGLAAGARAQQPMPVRYVEGTLHGFLSLRGQDGRVIAAGELSQVAHGSQVTARLTFHFRDGSLDDETTVFSQRGSFRLIRDHHVQQGPSFPRPLDWTIDVAGGVVTSRSKGKDGKDEVKTDHMRLPPDLANGLLSVVVKNLRADAAETKVSMVVATPKPRLVTLAISPLGEDPFTLAGSEHKARHYQIKIKLGGVAGVVAPIVGKQPPDIQMWVYGGDAPSFMKEVGPLFDDGPIWTMQLASPEWPSSTAAGL
jgi:hypothetical protein